MKIETLDDLLYEDLRGLYDEEQRLLEALPKMAHNASSEKLRQTLQQHVGETLEHVNRLDRCFRELSKHSGRETVNAMKGLIKDGERAIDQIPLSPLRDAAIVAAAKRVENYEIGAYTGTISFARLLGLESIAATLEQTLREERDTDAALSQLAESTVNRDARLSGAHPREQRV
jgi:ferritin-like metal-binding protein YciE